MFPMWKQSSLTESISRVKALLIVRSLWRHQQSIVTSWAERKPSEWDTGTMCKDLVSFVIYGFVLSCKKKDYVCTLVTNRRDKPFLRSLECQFGIYFPRCFATRKLITKIILSWALKQFVTRVHTLFSIWSRSDDLHCILVFQHFRCILIIKSILI